VIHGWIVAGTASGAGKTTATLALIERFVQQGWQVVPFKAGPDFLDPMHLAAMAGVPCENLDTQMMGTDRVRALFAARASRAQLAIVEGVMGSFDGAGGVGGAGSTVALAAALQLPMLLVVPAQGVAGTIVPWVDGFNRWAQRCGARIVGVIVRAGSRNHARMLADLLAEHRLPAVVAWIDDQAPALPSRHLGLVPPRQRPQGFAAHLHPLPAFEHLVAEPMEEGKAAPTIADALGARGRLAGFRIAVARDAAFSFVYPANLDWLRAEGAKLQFFSPLAGESPPVEADALWLPGGYPELFAERLARSPALSAIAAFVNSGRPTLAECGGMLVLGKAIEYDGRTYPMAGVLPVRFAIRPHLVALGYRAEVGGARGHEFHYAERIGGETLPPAFQLDGPGDRGIRHRRLRASFVHWWFPSAPAQIASWLSGG